MRKPHPHDPGVTHGRRARNVVVATGIVGATVAAGSVASDPTSDWYVSLDKPAWQPPGYVFPIAWTTLYTSIAVASSAVLNELEARGDTVGARKFGVALVRNQALNAFWSWVFFRWHNLPAATKCISLVPGLEKQTSMPASTSVFIRAWAPFMGGSFVVVGFKFVGVSGCARA